MRTPGATPLTGHSLGLVVLAVDWGPVGGEEDTTVISEQDRQVVKAHCHAVAAVAQVEDTLEALFASGLAGEPLLAAQGAYRALCRVLRELEPRVGEMSLAQVAWAISRGTYGEWKRDAIAGRVGLD